MAGTRSGKGRRTLGDISVNIAHERKKPGAKAKKASTTAPVRKGRAMAVNASRDAKKGSNVISKDQVSEDYDSRQDPKSPSIKVISDKKKKICPTTIDDKTDGIVFKLPVSSGRPRLEYEEKVKDNISESIESSLKISGENIYNTTSDGTPPVSSQSIVPAKSTQVVIAPLKHVDGDRKRRAVTKKVVKYTEDEDSASPSLAETDSDASSRQLAKKRKSKSKPSKSKKSPTRRSLGHDISLETSVNSPDVIINASDMFESIGGGTDWRTMDVIDY